jgi:hypothetical protein
MAGYPLQERRRADFHGCSGPAEDLDRRDRENFPCLCTARIIFDRGGTSCRRHSQARIVGSRDARADPHASRRKQRDACHPASRRVRRGLLTEVGDRRLCGSPVEELPSSKVIEKNDEDDGTRNVPRLRPRKLLILRFCETVHSYQIDDRKVHGASSRACAQQKRSFTGRIKFHAIGRDYTSPCKFYLASAGRRTM